MNKTAALNYCKEILQTEYNKANNKYSDINTQIEEGYYLSERKFNTLVDKKTKYGDIVEALEWGIRYLNNDIEYEEFLKRMRGQKNEY